MKAGRTGERRTPAKLSGFENQDKQRSSVPEPTNLPESEEKMIEIKQSKTADTRSCDFANVSKETLLASSRQHIGDVGKALTFFRDELYKADVRHDYDKISDIDGFHADFVTGFKQTGWWDRHRKINRHHLLAPDGVPEDVNLIDVLDMIADCVMAGMARTGRVYPLNIEPDVLMRAFQNTVTLLKSQVVVKEPARTEKAG
jgi:hypothetical protein